MTNDANLPSATRGTIRLAGMALIFGALAFVGVFSYLAARFNYPAVLDGPASEVLPALLATADTGRAVWAIYSLLPLCWIPAAVGAFCALRTKSEGTMRIATLFAALSSLAMVLGLMRWPSFHWALARAWSTEPGSRPALNALFDAANLYLGNYIGEFLGEFCVSIFFLLSAMAMIKRGSGFARWVAWLGIATAVLGLVGMFRNVTHAVSAVAAMNNYLLPVWMIVFGVSLVWHGRRFGPLAVIQ